MVSDWPLKINHVMLQLVEHRVRNDDETTAVQLHNILTRHGRDSYLFAASYEVENS